MHINTLGFVAEATRQSAIARLTAVRDRTDVGYGVQDDMNWLLERAGLTL